MKNYAMNNGLSWVWCLKAIFITILTAIPLVIYIVNSKTSGGQYQVYGSTHAQCIESDNGITSEVTKRRNELSRQLNDMSKKLGQIECEVCTLVINFFAEPLLKHFIFYFLH